MEKIQLHSKPEHQTLIKRGAAIIGLAGAIALLAGCESSKSGTPGPQAPQKPACEVQVHPGQPYQNNLDIYYKVPPDSEQKTVTYTITGSPTGTETLTQTNQGETNYYELATGHRDVTAVVTFEDGSSLRCNNSVGFDVHG